jgi:hypothetical protein
MDEDRGMHGFEDAGGEPLDRKDRPVRMPAQCVGADGDREIEAPDMSRNDYQIVPMTLRNMR